MTLSFESIAAHFDDQRGLPRAALSAWIDLVNDLAAGESLRVIEPGIGTGRVALPLAASGHRVFGTDISPAMLTACADSARGLGVSDRVEFLEADATDLPYDDQEFDLGVIAQLLYLVPDWPTVLDELARTVRSGGAVIHLSESTSEGANLQAWSSTWRERIEATGYRHTALAPTEADVHAEFLRRWPDTEVRALASWSFGQTVGDARSGYGERLRPLYPEVSAQDWNGAVSSFLAWGDERFADDDQLDGTVTLTATIAHL